MRRVHIYGLAALTVCAAVIGAVPAHAAGGSTLYVDYTNAHCSDGGSGAAAAPFCGITAAAAAAQPGDTVQVAAGIYGEVDITRSGTVSAPITFSGNTIGLGDSVRIGYANGTPTQYGFNVVGASNIVIRGFGAAGTASDVMIKDSHDITVDRVVGYSPASAVGIEVSGASSRVTLSRNFITTRAGDGVQIDSGVSGTTVTTNDVQTAGGAGITANGAPGTVITSNTVATQCGAGIAVSGASTGSTLENNIVDIAQNTSPEGSCGSSPSPISVDTDAVSGTTADYNLIDPASGGPLYTWNAAPYTSLSAFTTATSQGGHDLATNPGLQTVFNQYGLDLTEGSAAIDSADANAPGELATDVIGNPRVDDPTVSNSGTGPGYYDRGAYEFQAPLQNAVLHAAPAADGKPLDVTFTTTLLNRWSDNATYTYYFSDGTSQVLQSTAQTVVLTHTYSAPHPTDDLVNLDITDAVNRPEIFLGTTLKIGDGYTPLAPARILDTRHAIGVTTTTPIPGGRDVTLQIAGVGGVPADVNAVAFNLTETEPTASGYLTVYPDGEPLPLASNLNFGAGQTIPNLVTAIVTDGKIRIHVASAGTVQLVADLAGYYDNSGTGYGAVNLVRVLDTRHAIGVPGSAPLGPNGTLSLDLSAKVPAGATAAIMNVTETQPTSGGYLTVFPGGAKVPLASNLNFVPGQTAPNEVIVPVVNGAVQFHNGSAGTVHVIADLSGYFAPTSSGGRSYFIPTPPERLDDTRTGTAVGGQGLGPIYGPGSEMLMNGAAGMLGSTATVYNLTETAPQGGGYLTIYPTGTSRPLASNLNFSPGQTRANLAIVPLGADYYNGVNVYSSAVGTVQFILDMEGYFQRPAYQ